MRCSSCAQSRPTNQGNLSFIQSASILPWATATLVNPCTGARGANLLLDIRRGRSAGARALRRCSWHGWALVAPSRSARRQSIKTGSERQKGYRVGKGALFARRAHRARPSLRFAHLHVIAIDRNPLSYERHCGSIRKSTTCVIKTDGAVARRHMIDRFPFDGVNQYTIRWLLPLLHSAEASLILRQRLAAPWTDRFCPDDDPNKGGRQCPYVASF